MLFLAHLTPAPWAATRLVRLALFVLVSPLELLASGATEHIDKEIIECRGLWHMPVSCELVSVLIVGVRSRRPGSFFLSKVIPCSSFFFFLVCVPIS